VIDAEVYLQTIIVRDTEEDLDPEDGDIAIAPDLDVDELAGNYPALLWTLTGDGQVSNGEGLWTYTLTLSDYAEGMDKAKKWARWFYKLVHYWDEHPELTELEIDGDTIWVAGVEDIDVPTRQSSADVDGRHIVQYVGSYALALRSK
jgi:hypothetical protein